MKVLQAHDLAYTNGPSDKVYNIKLEHGVQGLYIVTVEYGRYGTKLTSGIKTRDPASYAQATTIYAKLLASKLKKGYEVVREQAQGFATDTPVTTPQQVPLIPAPRINKRRLRVAM